MKFFIFDKVLALYFLISVSFIVTKAQDIDTSIKILIPEMVKIDAGAYTIGGDWDYVIRRHKVYVKNFAIGKYEIMFDEYDNYCNYVVYK